MIVDCLWESTLYSIMDLLLHVLYVLCQIVDAYSRRKQVQWYLKNNIFAGMMERQTEHLTATDKVWKVVASTIHIHVLFFLNLRKWSLPHRNQYPAPQDTLPIMVHRLCGILPYNSPPLIESAPNNRHVEMHCVASYVGSKPVIITIT